MNVKYIILVLCLMISHAFAQQEDRVALGSMESGTTVSFIRTDGGLWGIEISGGTAPRLIQQKPVQIEIFRNEGNLQQLVAGYRSVKKDDNSILARAKLADGTEAWFDFEDRWSISGDVLYLKRKVRVNGTEDSSGFFSAMSFLTEPTINWKDIKYLIPGLLYGEPHTNARALGGSLYYNAGYFSIREDYLSAPLFGLSFKEGNWVALLDPAPDGNTTQEETVAPATKPIVDERIQFGAINVKEIPDGGVEFGFRLPGTTNEFSGGFWGGDRENSNAATIVRRRYNPIKDGFSQSYQIEFRFGKSKSFCDMERDTWRWAWQSLNPKITPVDIELVRRTVIDHLADCVLVVGERAGIPFVIDAVSGKPGSFRPALISRMFSFPNIASGRPANQNKELIAWTESIGIDIDTSAAELDIWPKIVIGFCGKNVEAAEQLLLESNRDTGPRGQRMRKLGEMIIESLISIVPTSPPSGEGFDIRVGKPSAVHGGTAFTLRSWAEDMNMMMDLIKHECTIGHQHQEWFKWVKSYTDWLLTQQREDGSFPMMWLDSTGAVEEGTTGVTSYTAVPLLVKMSNVTGDKKYLNPAINAADYIWKNFGSKCVFLGATGSSNVADKESGMLSLEAFLALYENTRDNKWLEYAKTAGDYTESWIWIWNVPMPIGANYTDLGWKPGVPTVGVNGIGCNDIGGVDQFLDWAVPAYARLYKYTNDEHYFNVARILLHGTKAMLALPGRTYDLKGPGWQQEHWRMGPIRGIGAHRTWLPWISVNHLHGITGLEDFDPVLYKRLSKGN